MLLLPWSTRRWLCRPTRSAGDLLITYCGFAFQDNTKTITVLLNKRDYRTATSSNFCLDHISVILCFDFEPIPLFLRNGATTNRSHVYMHYSHWRCCYMIIAMAPIKQSVYIATCNIYKTESLKILTCISLKHDI